MSARSASPTSVAPSRRTWRVLAALGLVGVFAVALWQAHALDRAAALAEREGAELRIVGLARGSGSLRLEIQLANLGQEPLLWTAYTEEPELTVLAPGLWRTSGAVTITLSAAGPVDWRLEPGEVMELSAEWIDGPAESAACQVQLHRPSGEPLLLTSRTIDLGAPRATLQARLAPTPGAPHRHSGGIPRWRSPAPWWRFWN